MTKLTYDVELDLYRIITCHLPRLKGLGNLGNFFMSYYRRKPRLPIKRKVLGFDMMLNPHECVDSALLFMPQLYEYNEVTFIKKRLKAGSIFIDLGSNIGFYTLQASKLVGDNGKILSIEASPSTFALLCQNIKINDGTKNIVLLNIGVSNKKEDLFMNVPAEDGLYRNRGDNSFLNKPLSNRVLVPCKPLIEILEENHIQRIDGMKIDIEGFEFRVLSHFLENASKYLIPDFLIIEQHQDVAVKEGDSIELLEQHGFQIKFKTKYNNFVMVRN